MLKVRIDRFEEGFVVCEDEERNFYDLRKSDFSIPLHEDDILLIELDGEGLGVVIGHRGETLDSLQYLTGLAASNGGGYFKVSLNIGHIEIN